MDVIIRILTEMSPFRGGHLGRDPFQDSESVAIAAFVWGFLLALGALFVSLLLCSHLRVLVTVWRDKSPGLWKVVKGCTFLWISLAGIIPFM